MGRPERRHHPPSECAAGACGGSSSSGPDAPPRRPLHEGTGGSGANGSAGGPPPPAAQVAGAGTTKTKPTSSRRRTVREAALLALRLLLLDGPAALLLVLLVAALCLRRVYDDYLSVQLGNMRWTGARRLREATYYDRRCDPYDMSTRDVEDLLLPASSTAEECVDHMMVHGASMYPGVLTDGTARRLRAYILERNAELSDRDAINVIANAHRWSFGFGANDDPAIAAALREIATHPLLAPALEGIAGNDPAVIEMTAITSEYGAADQFWHTDTMAYGNDLVYARSFVPSYSLFIPLQDTTAAMGATATCPGTHVCHDGVAEELCAEQGFQVSGRDGGVWRRGDGVLQNQHTYHRGPAHTGRYDEPRALFILSFAPRPNGRSESRMIGQGGSYSIRWDMWGHTLSDLADAPSRMVQPWTTLRALGLFRLPGTHWGWDYPSVVSMRIANEDVGFGDGGGDLETFVEMGSLTFLPGFITEGASDEGWVQHLLDCLDRSKDFLLVANKAFLSGYLLLAFVLSLVQYRSGSPKVFRRSALGRTLARLCLMCAVVAAIGHCALGQMSRCDWAKDLDRGHQFTSQFSDVVKYNPANDEDALRVVRPRKVDALFGVRYDGENYGSINKVLDYHNGNVSFRSIVRSFAASKHFLLLPTAVKVQGNKAIIEAMERQRRRLLQQNVLGEWIEASAKEAQELVARAIMMEQIEMIRLLDTEINLLIAKARFGKLRSTVLAQKASVDHLQNLKKLFFAEGQEEQCSALRKGANGKNHRFLERLRAPDLAVTRLGKQKAGLATVTKTSALSAICHASSKEYEEYEIYEEFELQDEDEDEEYEEYGEDYEESDEDEESEGQEIIFSPRTGDEVEAQYQGMHNEWYKGTVARIISKENSKNRYDVLYDDGDTDWGLPQRCLREYVPLTAGEVVEAMIEDEVWEQGVIINARSGGLYDLKFNDGEIGEAFNAQAIRRTS